MAETAYVLINCGLGKEKGIIREMREKFPDNVKEIMEVYGVYDIIAKLYGQGPEDLNKVLNGMKEIKKIDKRITVMVNDTYKKSD